MAEAARKHALTVRRGVWRERFFIGAENALRRRPADEEGQRSEIKRLKQKVGELAMDVDILKKATLHYGRYPTSLPRRCRGVHRAICRVLGVARSALYRHQLAPRTQPPTPEDSAATATRRLAAWGSTDVYQVPKSSGCCGYMRIFPHLRRDQGEYTEFSV